MALSAQHWNGNQVVAIDTETTGLDPSWNEVIEVAMIPLDSNFNVRKDVMPLNLFIKPQHPERKHEKVPYSKEYFDQIMETGFSPVAAMDAFEQWYGSLGLRMRKGGYNKCQVIPLGHNYPFDMGFLKAWLGIENYQHFFHYHHRDSMIAALMRNDEAARRGDPVPFPKVNLKYVATKLNVELIRVHRAIDDAHATAQVYRKLVAMGPMF